MHALPESLIEALGHHDEIEVAWVHGSVARDEARETSDVDLAVAFRTPCTEPWERVDALRAELQERVDRPVSVLDLNRAPTPLAHEAIRDGTVLVCRSDLRLRTEAGRIWSLWEEYRRQQSRSERPDETCVLAIREQVAQHVASVDELRERLQAAPLTFMERTATERSLQIVIEAAIGCAKHLLHAMGRPVPAEARTAIERVYEATRITEPPLAELRGAVGMRNAIIHDYPNLDWQLLETVLAEGRYRRVEAFVDRAASRLLDAGAGHPAGS